MATAKRFHKAGQEKKPDKKKDDFGKTLEEFTKAVKENPKVRDSLATIFKGRR